MALGVTNGVTIAISKDSIRRSRSCDPLIHWQFRVPELSVVGTLASNASAIEVWSR